MLILCSYGFSNMVVKLALGSKTYKKALKWVKLSHLISLFTCVSSKVANIGSLAVKYSKLYKKP